jgi:hypothetical protein
MRDQAAGIKPVAVGSKSRVRRGSGMIGPRGDVRRSAGEKREIPL